MRTRLYNMLIKYADTFHEVVPLNKAKDKLLKMDFSKSNEALTEEILGNTEMFTDYVHQLLSNKKYKYGIGGYDELRTVYKRSRVFDAVGEPRRLHLGVDIWGPAGTPVYAPIGGVIHSFAFNDDFGDYGATILLQHQLDGFAFYTLYGHLSLKDIAGLQEGQYITRGMEFAHFGEPHENGNWHRIFTFR